MIDPKPSTLEPEPSITTHVILTVPMRPRDDSPPLARIDGFVGGVLCTLAVVVVPMAIRAAMRRYRVAAWLARQPESEGGAYRKPGRRPNTTDPSSWSFDADAAFEELVDGGSRRPPRPRPTSVPGTGRKVLG